MTSIHELAPPRGHHEWGKATAFGLPTALGLFAAVTWLEGSPLLASIVGTVAFCAVFATALLLARPEVGSVAIADGRLLVTSGWMRVGVSIDDILSAEPCVGEGAGPLGTSLVTDPSRTVGLRLRDGSELRLSPLEPDVFLAALRREP